MAVDYEIFVKGIFAVGRITPSGVQLLGTAFATWKPGHFATASHVCGTDPTGLVLVLKPNMGSLSDYQDTSDTKISYFAATISAWDPLHDLAVLKTDTTVSASLAISGADEAPAGTNITTLGYPHADHGRMVLTRQDTSVGARVLIDSAGIKSKHLVLNTQARPGQSGSPVLARDSGHIVAVLVGSYAPGSGGGISLGGIDPHTLHQTTHAVSAEYLKGMLQ